MRFSNTTFTLVLLLWGSLSLGEQVPIIRDVGVPLQVTPGETSLMLSWEIPDSLKPRTIHLYRSKSPDHGFEEFAVLPSDQTRFNDREVEADSRYFYRIELDMGDGLVYTSSGVAPPFGRRLVPQTTSHPDSVSASSFEYLLSWTLHTSVQAMYPNVDIKLVDDLDRILREQWSGSHPWLALVRPDRLEQIHTLFSDWGSDSGIIVLRERLRQVEPVVRNELLLLPEEWNARVEAHFQHLEQRMETLNAAWSSDMETLEALPGAIPYQILSEADSGFVLTFTILHPARLQEKPLWLASGGDTLNLKLPDSLQPGMDVQLNIPYEWSLASFGQGPDHLRWLTFDPSLPIVNLYLSGDVDFESDKALTGLWMAPETQPVYINEWRLDRDTGKLQVELWNPNVVTEHWGVYLNDQLIWDVDFGFIPENSFLDSTVAVLENTEKPVWLTLAVLNEDEWNPTSSISLSQPALAGLSRQPDGGSWTESSPTLGRTNQTDIFASETLNIPEVFALYQNYPNPFNSQTTITFDLLHPAKVSLYVMDARGRVVDTFAEETPMERGTYTYSWSGLNHSSGIYFFTISAQVDNYLPVVFSRKMIYLK